MQVHDARVPLVESQSLRAEGGISCCANCNYVAVGKEDGEILVWDRRKSDMSALLLDECHSKGVSTLLFQPDKENLLVSGGWISP